jgi:protein-S-isoprenylcysteine O-methyltransferase Ste14
VSLLGSLVFLVIAPGTATVLAPWLITGWRVGPPFFGQTSLGVGALFLSVGLIVLIDCFVRFGVEGIGTPAPIAPTRQLVVRGLYRVVRNPMYLSVISIVIGEALLIGSWILLVYAALLAVAFHLFVQFYEEPSLKRRFGEDYEAYLAATPRWLPKVTRAPAPPPG